MAVALEACRRGVLVEIYADLGFNDEGELLPFQGGTNQMVIQDMCKELGEYRRNLKWYWYTGKDQKTPLNAKDKSRNCHVKLMSESGPRRKLMQSSMGTLGYRAMGIKTRSLGFIRRRLTS